MHKEPYIVFMQHMYDMVDWSFKRILEIMCPHVWNGYNNNNEPILWFRNTICVKNFKKNEYYWKGHHISFYNNNRCFKHGSLGSLLVNILIKS